MITVDASVWTSVLMEEDRFHHQSLHWLQQQVSARQEIIAPILLLVEVAGAIARLTGNPSRGEDSARQIQQNPAVRLLPLDDIRGAAAVWIAANFRLRGADATYVAVAHEMKVPLITWDQEQHRRAAVLIPVFTPDTAPFDP